MPVPKTQSALLLKRHFAQAAVAVRPKPKKQPPPVPPPKRKIKNHATVAVIGADTITGKALSFLLKQNPIVSRLYLHGKGIKGTVLDLQHCDTRCKVKGFQGSSQIPDAVRCAEIIVMMGLDKYPRSADAEKRVKYEAGRVNNLANICAQFAPRSILLVTAHPVSYILPIVTAAYKKTNWYHPGKVIGSADLTQIRVNSLTARYQDLDPVSVHVPIIGGPESGTVVPLFSRAQPVDLPTEGAKILQKRIKKIAKERTVKSIEKCELRMSSFSEAYAINRTVTTIAMGLCGDSRAACACFLRQNIISTCKHLVTTVKFGRDGVEHNYGIPKLTHLELEQFEKTLLRLRKREKKALKIVKKLKISPSAKKLALVQLSPLSSSRSG